MSSTNITLSSTLSYIQQQTIRYLYSTYLLFGILGCCLNIFLLSRRQFRTVSCCLCKYLSYYYRLVTLVALDFIASSVAMVIHLSVSIGVSIQAVDHVDTFYTISALCKLRTYGSQSTAMMFRWCLSMACFDRFALSSANVHLRNVATVRVARPVIPTIISLWLVLPVHTLVVFNVKGGVCGILNNYAVALYHSLYTIVFGSVLPILIMISCALLIHRNLIIKQHRCLNNGTTVLREINSISNVEKKRNQQVLKMLLIQVAVFTALTAPLMIFYIYSVVSLGIPNKSADRVAIERFFQFVAEATIYIFPVLSFYLYTLVSRTFRDELIKILRSGSKCKQSSNSNRIEPTGMDSTQERNIGNQFRKQPMPQSIALRGSAVRFQGNVNHQHDNISQSTVQ